MKKAIVALLFCLLLKGAFAQEHASDFITTDINNFWAAYDKIISTKDSAQQYAYLNQLFIDKGTPGLKAIMKARNYTGKSYIDAINSYPLFWNSVRANTLKAKDFADSIANSITKLKALYPDLKPAKIYFTIGAFRTGGTTTDKMVLIGSEIALADQNTVTNEFPQSLNGLKTYIKSNPINIVVFTNVHEYVHTQQKTTNANNLLAQCVLEGVAEFMAVKATQKASTLPALSYGRTHNERITQLFESQLFNSSNGFWLYSDVKNEFDVRDLGYYVGYAICEKYYNKAKNKAQAIKDMIELDYDNETTLGRFVDQSGYLSKPIRILKNEYEESRPIVTGIKQFKNNATAIDTASTQITILFSTSMDKRYRNFELGPLGKDNLLKIKHVTGFSDDGKSLTFEVELKPLHHYQLVVGEGFRNTDGIQLKPYLINLNTTNK